MEYRRNSGYAANPRPDGESKSGTSPEGPALTRRRHKPGLLPNLLLAALLLGGQFGSLLHAYEHDAGTPQGKVCTVCATANQLAAASVDSHPSHELEPSWSSFGAASHDDFQRLHVCIIRQRGPPESL
jgi:hypothetical protein